MIGRYAFVRVVRNVPDSPIATNAPATGDASTLSRVRPTVAARLLCRTATNAPTAGTAPSRKGTRPLHRFSTTATAPTAAAASACGVSRTATVISAQTATADSAITSSVLIAAHR